MSAIRFAWYDWMYGIPRLFSSNRICNSDISMLERNRSVDVVKLKKKTTIYRLLYSIGIVSVLYCIGIVLVITCLCPKLQDGRSRRHCTDSHGRSNTGGRPTYVVCSRYKPTVCKKFVCYCFVKVASGRSFLYLSLFPYCLVIWQIPKKEYCDNNERM